MNILHMKYAVEVAKAGSINKASENLLIAQPNLSRAIKDLEADLSITIFDRSTKGMVLTADGEEFISNAKKILRQIDEVEMMYKQHRAYKKRFSISVPHASYISDAFANFSNTIGDDPVELYYTESTASRAIKNIFESDYNLAIIRYAKKYDRYFKEMMEARGLEHELIAEFSYVLLMNAQNPLANKDEILFSDLRPYIEIAHGDPYVPSLPMAQVKREELPDDIDRRINVFERASQFDILSRNAQTFMWVSPTPDDTLNRYGLIQRESPDNTKVYMDVLIYRKDYRLSELDKSFITQLYLSKDKYL